MSHIIPDNMDRLYAQLSDQIKVLKETNDPSITDYYMFSYKGYYILVNYYSEFEEFHIFKVANEEDYIAFDHLYRKHLQEGPIN